MSFTQKKAIRQKSKFALEVYDKDNDVYETIAENDDIETLRQKAIAIADKNPTMNSGEPVDWFLITDCIIETPIEYLDMYEKTWKKYITPKPPNNISRKDDQI